MNIHGAWNVAHFRGHFLSESVVRRLGGDRAGDGYVDRSRRTEVENLRDDVRGLEVELDARKTLREFRAEID